MKIHIKKKKILMKINKNTHKKGVNNDENTLKKE